MSRADLTGPSPFLHFATVRYSQFLYFYHIKISLKCNVRFLVFLYNSVFMKRIAAVPRQEKAAPTGSFPNNHSIFSFLVTVRLQLLYYFIKESFRKM